MLVEKVRLELVIRQVLEKGDLGQEKYVLLPKHILKEIVRFEFE